MGFGNGKNSDNIHWRFPKLDGGTEQGYTNQDIETFKGKSAVDNLTREIIQNSLDAGKDPDKEPVIVEFRMTRIKQSGYAMFREYRQLIEGCKEYWKYKMDTKLEDFLKRVDYTLENDAIPVLIASDYNTRGLTGSKEHISKKSAWRALTQSDGTSVKDTASAGSYGVGKNAPFACSTLSMVFYNTYAQDDEKAFQGVARLATLYQNDEPTQRVGHYKYHNSSNSRPIVPEDKDKLQQLVKRDCYGTDILIMGFSEPHNWKEAVAQAVLRYFFLAVHENRLIVRINDQEIRHDNLDENFKRHENGKNIDVAQQMYDVVVNPGPGFPKSKNMIEDIINDENNVQIYFKKGEKLRRKIGYFRNTGMLVNEKRKNKITHFIVVVVVRGLKLSDILKEAEPAKHNRWDHKIITDDKKRDKARRAIKDIEDWVEQVLAQEFHMAYRDKIDAGVADYLPDEELSEDPLPMKTDTKDEMKPIQRISEESTFSRRSRRADSGNKDKGKPDKGAAVTGERVTKRRKKRRPPIKGIGEIPGGKRGEGDLTLYEVDVKGQRVVPLNYKQGVYRISILPEETVEKAHIVLRVVGEDNSREPLRIKKCTQENHKNNIIGPVKLNKGIMKQITLNADFFEKAVLDMVIGGENSHEEEQG